MNNLKLTAFSLLINSIKFSFKSIDIRNNLIQYIKNFDDENLEELEKIQNKILNRLRPLEFYPIKDGNDLFKNYTKMIEYLENIYSFIAINLINHKNTENKILIQKDVNEKLAEFNQLFINKKFILEKQQVVINNLVKLNNLSVKLIDKLYEQLEFDDYLCKDGFKMDYQSTIDKVNDIKLIYRKINEYLSDENNFDIVGSKHCVLLFFSKLCVDQIYTLKKEHYPEITIKDILTELPKLNCRITKRKQDSFFQMNDLSNIIYEYSIGTDDDFNLENISNLVDIEKIKNLKTNNI